MTTSNTYDRADAPADALRLHLNEHTGGCSPSVIEAIRGVTAGDIAKYQDYSAVHVAVARLFGVEPTQVLLTNGLDEGLLAATVACLRDGHTEAVILEPAFGMYADCVDAVGGEIRRVLPRDDFSFDLDAVRDAITPRTGLVFATSPGNPTGLSMTAGQVRALAGLLPREAILLLDEAYAEFAPDSFLSNVAAAEPGCENVIVGRTFAKAYGLAGLRIGALVGNAATLARLRRVVPPYSLNVFVVAALAAALDDTEYVRDYVRQVDQSRQLMYAACDRLGLEYVPSDANFVLIRANHHRLALLAGLEERGIYVRDRHTQPGCQGCIRITTGVVGHTQLCIAAMEDILCARE